MPQKKLRKVFVRLAFEVDPEGARLGVLAEELEVGYSTMLAWINKGKVTPVRARDINRRFGDVLAPLSVLTGGKS